MRIAPRAAAAARAASAAAAVHGRLHVRVRVPADPLDHPAARARQPRRRAVLGADAGLRGDGVPRRPAHARLPDDRRPAAARCSARCGWRRGDRSSASAGSFRSPARCSASGLIAFSFTPRAVARDPVPRRRRLRLHGADGVEQHGHPDDRRRRKARPRDELLHDGVSRHRAVRQPDRRLAVVAHRRGAHAAASAASAASPARCGSRARCRRSARRCGRSTSGWASCPRWPTGLANAAELSVPPERL